MRYISVPKVLIDDIDISLKAKGLYALILAQPLNWDNSISALVEASGEGHTAIRNAIHELEQAGYLERRLLRGEKGGFAGAEYTLKEGRKA